MQRLAKLMQSILGSAMVLDTTKLVGKVICLVTSGNVGSNPRIIKEADALHAAGAIVHVIAMSAPQLPHVQQRDDGVVDAAAWVCTRVSTGGQLWRVVKAVLNRIGLLAFKLGVNATPVILWAYNPRIGDLTRAACAIPADMYIAHNLAALPAASRAAQRYQAKLGFDAEDFHSGELTDSPENAYKRAVICTLERRFLPACDYLTAAAPGIARVYAKAYALKTPSVILNVFSRVEAPEKVLAKGTSLQNVSLYWFSQTIGPDRGLETVVKAIALSASRPMLYLRGSLVNDYKDKLEALARQHGISKHLHFLAPANPTEMARLAAQHDVGIASEVDTTLNRDICLTNKIFTYLLAGIPILASSTTAQVELAQDLNGAMWCYPQNDSQSLAELIDKLLISDEDLSQARQRAFSYGQNKFNWDVESIKLLKIILECFEIKGGVAC